MAKKKRPLPPSGKKENGIPEEDNDKKGPWWRKSDADLVKDRYQVIRTAIDDRKMKVDEEDRTPLIEEAVKRDPDIINILDLVPLRRKGIGRDGDFLLIPIYNTKRGERIADFLRLKTRRRIRLDEYGWAVWDLINNRRDIRQIGSMLGKRFGDKVKPIYPRLAKFVAYLESLRIVNLKR
ncbi:MAG: PqqD family protein [Thermoplasmatota archaeon]